MVQVIYRALNTEPCLSLNESSNNQRDKDLIFNCMTKVLNSYILISFEVLKNKSMADSQFFTS